MNNKGNFFSNVLGELKKVTWPTKNETVNYVIAVIVASVFVAAILGLLDLLFFHLLETYIL